MKIIGKTHDGFICTASADELAMVQGFGGAYGMPDHGKPASGQEIGVSDLWSALKHTRARMDDARALSSNLRALADRVDFVNEKLKCPSIPPPPKEKKGGK